MPVTFMPFGLIAAAVLLVTGVVAVVALLRLVDRGIVAATGSFLPGLVAGMGAWTTDSVAGPQVSFAGGSPGWPSSATSGGTDRAAPSNDDGTLEDLATSPDVPRYRVR